MKSKIFKYLIIIMLIFPLSAYLGNQNISNNENNNELLSRVVMYVLNNGHYHPCKINDEFSNKVFKQYLKKLDYNKIFLIQPDIDKLNKYKYDIDDEIKKGTFEFFNLSSEIIDSRIKEAEKYYKEILDKPFNFDEDETVKLDKKNSNFSSNKKDLEKEWHKYLKYQTLTRIGSQLELQAQAKKKNDTTVKIKSFKTIEQEARAKVIKNYNDLFHRLSKYEKNSDRFSDYINSIVSIYDPHTSYFPPKDKENFDIQISGKLEGIGAQLQEKNRYIKVVKIIPGSASWRQKELQVGDIILKVGQGDKEPVDVVDMRLDDAVKLIRGKKGTEVRLTVKKIDGRIVVIPIIRDVVVLEETYAKSCIIRDKKHNKNIGYIRLPSFYVDFKNKSGRNCADDVKKEIDKLKQENVSSIIFDLRGNGGGSLQDAVKIAGLFIKVGPIVQVKARYGAPRILRDRDPSIEFKGPLLLMVNSLSASASEIFAAAMQDYQRGIILGSHSTFGKGTVQRFADLDRFVRNKDDNFKSLGSLKITIQKFYRINGDATQLKGVTPDIIFPDAYTYLDIGEKDLDYPMPWDEIKPVEFEKWNSTYDLKRLEQDANKEIKDDSTFILIDQNAKRLKKQKNKTLYTLNLKKYLTYQKQLEKISKKYENIVDVNYGLDIHTLQADLPAIKADSSKMAINKSWHKNLDKDIYLNEAVNIIENIDNYKK